MTGKADREEKQKNRKTEKQDISAGMYCQDWMVDAVLYTKIRAAKECDITVNYNDGRAISARKLVGPVVVSALRDYAMPKL